MVAIAAYKAVVVLVGASIAVFVDVVVVAIAALSVVVPAVGFAASIAVDSGARLASVTVSLYFRRWLPICQLLAANPQIKSPFYRRRQNHTLASSITGDFV